jgi:hypothetical protein
MPEEQQTQAVHGIMTMTGGNGACAHGQRIC